jgi:GNAT superfamily N-acetyltransferase
MMVSFTIQADDPIYNAGRALVASLHNGYDGELNTVLSDIVHEKEKSKSTVAIATNGRGNDIGVCVIESSGAIGTYVKPEYRGCKIGEKLVRAAMTKSGRDANNCYAFLGIDSHKSFQFYSSLGIFVDEELVTREICGSSKEAQLWRDILRLHLKKQSLASRHFLWNYKFEMSKFLVEA